MKRISISIIMVLLFWAREGSSQVIPDIDIELPEAAHVDTTLTNTKTFVLTDSLSTIKKVSLPSIFPYDTVNICTYRIQETWFDSVHYFTVDTTLRFMHTPTEDLHNGFHYQHLGNTGLASKKLFFDPTLNMGFIFGDNVFQRYSFDKSTLHFYHPYKPYSLLYYKMGDKMEKELNLTMSQRLYRGLTMGLDVRFIQSKGAYTNQKTNNQRVGITLQYESDNRRYYLQSMFSYNFHEVGENGGIIYNDQFTSNTYKERQMYDVYLRDATNLNRRKHFYTEHAYLLQSPKSEGSYWISLGAIKHKFSYDRDAYRFTETIPSGEITDTYYNNFYIDKSASNDTLRYSILNNTFSWSNATLLSKNQRFHYDFGLSHQLIHYRDSIISPKFHQILLHALISQNIYHRLWIGGEAEYVQGKINANDFKIAGYIRNTFYDKLHFKASLSQINYAPAYMYQHHFSNHFKWDNRLSNENVVKANCKLRWDRYTGGANYYLLTNYTFFNEKIEPEQIKSSFSVMQLYFRPQITLGKFYIDSYLYLQKSSRKELSLPLFTGSGSIAFHDTFFKKALYYQVGINIFYKSLYYSDAYMPALRQFYHQEKGRIGDFIYGEIYASFAIKTAHIMVKYRNASQGITPYKYYSTPDYPMKDKGIEFSISWRLLN